MKKLISSLSLLTIGTALSVSAQAGMYYDSQYNVGFDTLAECEAAVDSNTARFYQETGYEGPMVEGQEIPLQVAQSEEKKQVCEIGGEEVEEILQGKHIPYESDAIVYADASSAVSAALGTIPTWVPVAAGVVGVIAIASSGGGSSSSSGATGTK